MSDVEINEIGPECVVCGYPEWEQLTPWKNNYHLAYGHAFTCACGFVGDGGHQCPDEDVRGDDERNYLKDAIDTIAGFDPDEMSWADIGREARAVAIAARDQYEEGK